MTQRQTGRARRKFGKAIETYLKALDNLVESPDPLEGLVDEGSRAVNRCMATTSVISGLPAVEAARILAHAAAAIEEEPEGRGCLSMLIGEAVRLQAGSPSLELESLEREKKGLERVIESLENEQVVLEEEYAELEAEQTKLRREIRDLMRNPGKTVGSRNPRDVH